MIAVLAKLVVGLAFVRVMKATDQYNRPDSDLNWCIGKADITVTAIGIGPALKQ